MKKILYAILICFVTTPPLLAQRKKIEMDSALFVYYQRCEREVRNSKIFLMADTLFSMAGKVGDKRTQAAALCHKANYFYFNELSHDSLRKYVNRVQEFAKATHQPKYYYWIWQRYTENYIQYRQYNLALLELEAMQKEAIAESYYQGLVACYKLMSHIYTDKKNYPLAYKYQKKALDLSEQYHTDETDFNLCNLYATLAATLMNLNRLDEAYPYIQKAYAVSLRPSQVLSVKAVDVSYWQRKKNPQRMLALIQEMETLHMPGREENILDAKYLYYVEVEDFVKANAMVDSLIALNSIDKQEEYIRKIRVLPHLPGRDKETISYYSRLQTYRDSLAVADSQISLEEFSTIMDVTRLNADNTQLELKLSQQKLYVVGAILAGLGILILVMGVFMVKVMRLNRHLHRSKDELQAKNDALEETRQLVLVEKERAESASRMKTAFIQNMSHEIRTPLNSIVGFSQALADELKESDDVKMFADIISKNSNDLLKLVGDVIELSSLDAIDQEDVKEPVYVNAVCMAAMTQVEPLLQPGVELKFEAWENEYPILSCERRIQTVISNLVHNAAKFTQEGSIVIACHLSEAKRMEISVTDTGIGIPNEKKEWVFERFAKVNQFSQGTGLGLSISRLAAQRIGGEVLVDTAYTEGCRMIFTFPAVKGELQQ